MESATSDLSDYFKGDKYKLNKDSLSSEVEVTKIIEDIKLLLDRYNNPKKYLNEYIRKVEATMIENNYEGKKLDNGIDKNQIRSYIEKHPYFKNPCNYHIRLLTIMKYLKKKGIDTSIKDIDLVVEDIIQEIDGVKKVGEGRFVRISKGGKKS